MFKITFSQMQYTFLCKNKLDKNSEAEILSKKEQNKNILGLGSSKIKI